LDGSFNYYTNGILDNSHLRFFTKMSFLQWIEELNSINMEFNYDCGYLGATRFDTDFQLEREKKEEHLFKIIKENPDFNTLQFLFKLTKSGHSANTPNLEGLLKQQVVHQANLIDETIKELEQQNKILNAQNEGLEQRIKLISAQREALGQLNNILIAQREDLERYNHRLEREISNIHSTLSWRITKPLRYIRALFRH
jgi:hypothetical protein